MSEMTASNRTCPKCGAPMASDTIEGLCPACLLAMNLAAQTELTGEEPGSHGTKKASPPPKTPPAPDEIRAFFPQFDILECLGRGGMGVVYKARQKSLDRIVALKILAPEREKDPQFAERFGREAKTLARLNHPSIVTVHDFGEAGGLFYLVMEFVDGVNLRHLLRERKLSPEEALAIVPKVCEALQFAHEQGIVHRDIKPENLLLDRQGRIKIADFGIAKILGRREPAAGETREVIGTPRYMAPEQMQQPQRVDHRADIYSLGVVLYEMLTGEVPAGKIQPPSKKVQLDVRIDEIVMRALEQSPELRYQTAADFRTQVETFATTPVSSSGRQSAPSEDKSRLTSAATKPPRFSRTALSGAIWVALFFVNWILMYTPPGWALTRFFRGTPLQLVAELLLFLPLTVLGFAAVAGGSALGLVALRQIRQAQGQLRGFGLALFDVLFFPMLLLNGWAIWLARRVISATGAAPSPLTVVVLILAALVLNALLIRAAARIAKQFVNSPAPPARPPVRGDWSQVLKATALRLVLVFAAQLALFETLEQFSVHWKESTSELWTMVQMVTALAGLIWACWPGYRLKRSWPFWIGGTVVSALLLLGLLNFYGWILRPNLGLYREPDWVARHPSFQKQMRQRIEKNLWRKTAGNPAQAIESTSLAPTTAQTLSFGPVIEREISSDQSHMPETNWWALNLASGKVMRFDLTRPPNDVTNWFEVLDPSIKSLDRRLPSLRAAGVDLFQALAASVPDSVMALDMRLVSLGADGWNLSAEEAMAQLDKAAGVGVIRSEVLIGGGPVYAFATKGRAKGVLQISENQSPARLRYKLVQNAEAKTASSSSALPKADSAPNQFMPSETETIDLGNGIKMEFVLIHPGSFIMGCLTGAATHYPTEKPAHEVTITKPFYLGKFEVTQEQWESVMDKNRSRFKGPKLPVENVSWDACHDFLFELQKKTRRRFALPTEAQWEYACRAGSQTDYSFGDSITELTDYAWFSTNSGGGTRPVGEKKPNPWRLYDMHGNVAEWCADWLVDYAPWPVTDPQGPRSSIYHVVRGGAWNSEPKWLRSSYRASDCQGHRRVGMRCVMLVEEVDAKSNPCPGFDASARIPGFAMACQECHVPRVGKPAPELKEKQDAQVCVNFMKFVVLAARNWAANHDGVMPPTLSTMSATLKSPSILVCPQILFSPNYTNQLSWAHFNSKDVSYEIVSPRLRIADLTAVYLRCPVHKKVARVDGSIGDDAVSKPETEMIDLGNGLNMEFVLIHPGSFVMGCTTGAATNDPCEKPAHLVTITKPFYLGKFEVTQEQWESVMDKNPSGFKGPKSPVDNVSWDDCQDFLFELQKKTRRRIRLPTEAQWEYACRAGTQTAYSFGDSKTDLPEYAWFSPNSGGRTHPVGEKQPNPWGLHDMHGNVVEWCADWLDDYAPGSATDPQGPVSSIYHVARGGCWESQAKGLRSSNRASDCQGYQRMGFRCAMLVEEVDTKSNTCPGVNASARITGFAMTCQECHVPHRGTLTSETKEKQDAEVCSHFMKFVVLAARSWAANHDGMMPGFSAMMNKLQHPSILVCPQILFSPNYTNQLSWGHFNSKDVTYEIVSSGLRSDNLTAAYLRCPIHKKVARVDGSISDDALSKPVKP